VLSGNGRAGNVTLDEPDPSRQSAPRPQRLPGVTQHRGGAIHGVERVTRIRRGETKSHVGWAATQIEHGGFRAPLRKGLMEQGYVGLVRFGKVGRGVSARLILGVHQLRFGDSFHRLWPGANLPPAKLEWRTTKKIRNPKVKSLAKPEFPKPEPAGGIYASTIALALGRWTSLAI